MGRVISGGRGQPVILCGRCGSDVLQGANFCAQCGSSVADVTPEPTAHSGAGVEDETVGMFSLSEGQSLLVPQQLGVGLYRSQGTITLTGAAGEEIKQFGGEGDYGKEYGLVRITPDVRTLTARIGDAFLCRVDLLPSLSPVHRWYLDSTFLVGPDLEPGQYWLDSTPMANGGNFICWAKLDESLQIIDSGYEEDRPGTWLAIDGDVFALNFSGLLRHADSLRDNEDN